MFIKTHNKVSHKLRSEVLEVRKTSDKIRFNAPFYTRTSGFASRSGSLSAVFTPVQNVRCQDHFRNLSVNNNRETKRFGIYLCPLQNRNPRYN